MSRSTIKWDLNVKSWFQILREIKISVLKILLQLCYPHSSIIVLDHQQIMDSGISSIFSCSLKRHSIFQNVIKTNSKNSRIIWPGIFIETRDVYATQPNICKTFFAKIVNSYTYSHGNWKSIINDRLRVSKAFWKFCIPIIYNFAIISITDGFLWTFRNSPVNRWFCTDQKTCCSFTVKAHGEIDKQTLKLFGVKLCMIHAWIFG